MTHSELTQLMHAVLDGEATPAESRELELGLAGDPAARTEFDALQRLFDGLAGIPQGFPPEGLVASVMANLPQRSPEGDESTQPFASAGVIGAASKEARGFNPGKSATVQRVSQTGPFFRGENMSQQKSGSFGKRKIWIGAGIAVAAAAVAVSTGLFPPEGKDVTGTIVPAQRYRAAQPSSEDVKVGGQSGSSIDASNPTNNGAGAAGNGAAGNGAAGNGAAGNGAAGNGAAGNGASGNGAAGNGAAGNGAAGNGASGIGASGNGARGNGASGIGASGNGASGNGASGNGASGNGASGNGANAVAR